MTLREGTVFSDGSPLTSADVVNAFERNGESDLYGAFLSFITAVSAPDERTVRFKLNAPMGSVLQERLALVRVFPATITDEELASKPVGSGPWCYETINAADGGRISFTANHRYTGPWPATCERMEWSVLLDDTRRTDELIDKDVMVMEAAPVVRAEELADAGATVEWVPGFNLPFLMFNCEKPPFDDVRVRPGAAVRHRRRLAHRHVHGGPRAGGHVPSARLLPALPPRGHGLQLRPGESAQTSGRGRRR